MSSYFQASSAERFVTVWPADESGFYDVAYGSTAVDGWSSTAYRVTAYEAAAYVLTEVGVGVGVTLAGVERRIREWRAEYDASPVEPCFR